MSTVSPQAKSTPRHSVSVAGAVLRKDGRLWQSAERTKGLGSSPGGVLELAEAPEAGVRREVLEETGIEVEVNDLTGVYKNTTLRCEPTGGTERTSAESTAVAWLTPNEVAAQMSEIYAIHLLDALDKAGPDVRSHDGRQFLTT
ncbi:NUDIX hydrolase [Streptomyces venezuelae]|uniref:NUDIX hydrolase n=1 Tax=Streptomyces venezuelae TaxID=54571 RepID=UPI003EB82271